MTTQIDKTDLGVIGEQLAVVHLEKSGYVVLEQNYRSKTGEIDIIAREGEQLCFVEVKMRSGEEQGHPLESITPNKQRKLSLTALSYLQEHDLNDQSSRFDVVSILQIGTEFCLDLIPNAFDSMY